MKPLFFTIVLFLHGILLAQNPSWPFEIPEIKPNDTVIAHTAISLLYSERHEQAVWVAYKLLGEDTYKSLARSNRFLVDPRVSTGTATHQDYLKSGYDRGHLAPAADFGWSVDAMNESFYYSNMSPQLPGFNRGVWKRLETQVRNWARVDSCIYIITGPVLRDSLKAIGPNAVSVPESYYKVILDFYSKAPKGIGFIIPNASSSADLSEFAMTIEDVERITGINFFPKLNSTQIHNLEKHMCIPCWTWTSTAALKKDEEQDEVEEELIKVEVKEDLKVVKEPMKQAVQCTGTTKARKRCGNKTLNANQKCHLHSK